MFRRRLVIFFSIVLLLAPVRSEAMPFARLGCFLRGFLSGFWLDKSDYLLPDGFNLGRAAVNFMQLFGVDYHTEARLILSSIPVSPVEDRAFADVKEFARTRPGIVDVVKFDGLPNVYVRVRTLNVSQTDPARRELWKTNNYPRYKAFQNAALRNLWVVRVVGPVERSQGERYLLLFDDEIGAKTYLRVIAGTVTSGSQLLRVFRNPGYRATASNQQSPSSNPTGP